LWRLLDKHWQTWSGSGRVCVHR